MLVFNTVAYIFNKCLYFIQMLPILNSCAYNSFCKIYTFPIVGNILKKRNGSQTKNDNRSIPNNRYC